ncbi:predicted protein [Postia placenta Mad-698-R]|nr:predicted protein [Postia placenta Mad-698-R]
MTVTRGFTEEADKLLDFLEHGIFDALQKQYLRSFIFAVYLDSHDPGNIVEAYTFNFNYYKVPGTDVSVPVMSLDAELQNLSLSGAKKMRDPVSEAAAEGRVPTLGEALIKNLIQATTQMDPLPKRRYATFKLFYYDHTPDDYEPAHFRPGDAQKDKWFFSTHNKDEVPERCSVGSLKTGHHAVDVRVASVSGYLPSSEDNDAPFLGTTTGHVHAAPALTPVEEAAMRLQQVQLQREDALARHVVWDADDGLCDIDADGEEDPEYAAGSDDSNESVSLGSWRVHDSGVEFLEPIGIRDEDGQIVPFPKDEAQRCPAEEVQAEEAQYAGRHDNVPNHVAQLPKGRNPRSRRIISPMASIPPSDIALSTASSQNPEIESIDTQMVQQLIVNKCVTGGDSEMLEIDTQVIPSSVEDPIDSFQSMGDADVQQEAMDTSESDDMLDKPQDKPPCGENLECECGVPLEDSDTCFCDGGCKRWFHTWCMGYHSAKDSCIPTQFICFDCRVKADENWDLIMVHDLYPRMIARFRDLAIFRRAIKIAEMHNPEGLSAFTKLLGCDSTVAGQQFKRLETEGFITSVTKEVDDFGLETIVRGKKGKSKINAGPKTRQSQRRKTLQKPRYVFVKASTNNQAYKDYFDPNQEVEKRLLGDHIDAVQTPPCASETAGGSMYQNCAGSQTQEEIQVPEPVVHPGTGQTTCDQGRKRKSNTLEQLTKTTKKMKISVGPGVDLGD